MKEDNETKRTIFRKSLYGFSENQQSVSTKAEKFNTEIEQDKERNFVNLMVDIVVSLTLKQLHEKGD